MSQLSYCNEGCQKQFYIGEIKTDFLPSNVEKVYLNCSHCGHEYVAFYTDIKTRELQERMRKLHRRFANPSEDRNRLIKQEAKLKKQIKASMDKLRKAYT